MASSRTRFLEGNERVTEIAKALGMGIPESIIEPMQITDPNLYSAEAVRTMDRMAVEVQGISSLELMQRAGKAAYAQLRQHFPNARKIAVVCGAGNNAGDGYVVARLALEDNCQVDLFALAPPSQLTGDAADCARNFLNHPQANLHSGVALPDECDVIVDALLGIGLSRELVGDYRLAVDRINQHSAPCLSLDVPSGVNSDSGQVHGVACKASLTVCFIAWKAGLFLAEGRDLGGNLELEKLGVDESVVQALRPMLGLLCASRPFDLCPRKADCHKGRFGHVVLIGGNYTMPGAIRLAAEACLNAGAGVVSVITRPEHAVQLASCVPELMCQGVTDAEQASDLLQRASVIAIGPGLGQDEWAEALFLEVSALSKPVIADADALGILSRTQGLRPDWVLTPHPGEAGKLLDRSTEHVQRDRVKASADLYRAYGATIVLKGRGTLIAGSEPTCLALGGTPAMAAPGMGDVLCGLIAGLIAQGLNGPQAAMLGVQVHNRAADLAAGGRTRGMRASDVIKEIPACAN
ncbi:MAG: NAD(P)H-hydrate dehydratase [Pseudomonadota bacterium]